MDGSHNSFLGSGMGYRVGLREAEYTDGAITIGCGGRRRRRCCWRCWRGSGSLIEGGYFGDKGVDLELASEKPEVFAEKLKF